MGDLFNWYLMKDGKLCGDLCTVEARHDEFIRETMAGTDYDVVRKRDKTVLQKRCFMYVQLPPPTERRGDATHAALRVQGVLLRAGAAWYRLINPDRFFTKDDQHLTRLARVTAHAERKLK
jgi:hypothetical protein